MKQNFISKISLVATMFSLFSLSASGADYYVKANGNNNNPGSFEQPFSTVGKAIDMANSEGGDIIYIIGRLPKEGRKGINKKITIKGIENATLDGLTDGAPTGNGYGFFQLQANADIRIEGVAFKNSKITVADGGAIDCQHGSSLTLVECDFIDNAMAHTSGNNVGGAIRLGENNTGSGVKCEIINCRFINNISRGVGGAIATYGICDLAIYGSLFDGNKTLTTDDSGNVNGGATGGAINMNNGDKAVKLTVINTTIVNNKAAANGSAINVERENASSRFTFVNCTIANNEAGLYTKNNGWSAVRFNTNAANAAGLHHIQIDNCVFAKNFTTGSDDKTSYVDMAIQKDVTASETANISIRNSTLQRVSMDQNVWNTFMKVDNAMQSGKDNSYSVDLIGLSDFDSNLNICPLKSSESAAYNLGNAQYLSDYGYHTDQLKQYRPFTDGKCHAGAAEFVMGGNLISTTSITATEIKGYIDNSLASFTELKLTGDYTNELARLQAALGVNKTITGLAFDTEFTGTLDQTNLNPNCLVYLPEGTATAPADMNNVIAGTTALTKIELTDGNPFACTDGIIAAKGVTYTRNCYTDGGWETIVLPFAVSSFDEFDDYVVEKYEGYNSTEGQESVLFKEMISLDGWEADKAYIMKVKTASGTALTTQSCVFEGAEGTEVKTEVSSDAFAGTFKEIPAVDVLILDANGEYFGKAGEDATIPAFRASLDPSALPVLARQYGVVHEGETTGICLPDTSEDLNIDKPRKVMTKDGLRIIVKDRVYTIEGKRIN